MVSGSRARAKGLGLEVTVCRGLEIEYYIIYLTISIRFAITEHFLCVYFKSRPLLLQLCLLWVSLIIKLPSSQPESISQGLHGSAPPPSERRSRLLIFDDRPNQTVVLSRIVPAQTDRQGSQPERMILSRWGRS